MVSDREHDRPSVPRQCTLGCQLLMLDKAIVVERGMGVGMNLHSAKPLTHVPELKPDLGRGSPPPLLCLYLLFLPPTLPTL